MSDSTASGCGCLILCAVGLFLVIGWSGSESQPPTSVDRTPNPRPQKTQPPPTAHVDITEAESAPSQETESTAQPRSTIRKEGTEAEAIAAARERVLAGLKFPFDASFPWFETTASFNADLEAWDVTGKVKAKNALGAVLTHQYWCTVALSDGKWRGVQLKIAGDRLYDNSSSRRSSVARRRQAELDANPLYQEMMADKRKQELELHKERVERNRQAEIGRQKSQRVRVAQGRISTVKLMLKAKTADRLQTKWMQEVAEEHKGTDLEKEANELLKQLPAR